MKNKLREAIKLNREINNYKEDAVFTHCPFPHCKWCNYLFEDLVPAYDFTEMADCPCKIYSQKIIKETVKRIIGEI